MAGTLAVIPSKNAIRDQWEICFARFIPYPATTTTTSTTSDLIPIPPRIRNHPPRGNWISSSSVAFLRLLTDFSSSSDVILTVSFNSKLLEEHYVSKLYFSWPQVSCVSGFPARGIRTVLVSYRDSLGEIQKFAMRFPTIYEAESFIKSLEEIMKDLKSPEPLNTDFGSAISSQSEFMSSNKLSRRACEEPSFMTPVGIYIPQMPQSINSQRVTPSGTQEKAKSPAQNFEMILPALPPSFTSLLMDCSEINHAQSTVSKEVDLKSQIMRYMEDSSFQGTRVAVTYQNEVAGSYGLPPTPARRSLFIVYQTAIPYIAERISSRLASRGIILANSESAESYNENVPRSSSSLISAFSDLPSSSTSGQYIPTLTRLKEKLGGFWLHMVQRWPAMLPIVRELLQMVLRANLMLFYFEGLYYHISKRAAVIRYVFIGKASNQRPRYQILGVFLLIQLCVIAAEGLRQRNLTSIASSVHQASFATHHRSAGHGLPVLNEEGALASPDNDKGTWISDSSSSEHHATGRVSKCTLCLSNRQHPTATSCGHVFCWNCITEWCNEKPECPLCRTPLTHSSLVCVHHSDF